MPISKVAVVSGALILAAAVTLLPVGVAGAQTPSTFVAIPSDNATVSGTSQILDAGASSGVTQVQYEITGGTLNDSVIATATATIYGWIALWNTTTVANGTYTLQSVATSNGVSGTSAPVTITVNNPNPSTEVLIPSNNATVSGTSQVLDAVASSGVTQVQYEITGGTLNDSVIATATPTIYGWIALWNTTGVVNGTYTLQSVATSNGVSGTSAPVTITVNNPTPSTEVLIPSNNATVSGTSQVLDAVASSGVTQVQYEITGGTLNDSVIATATPTIYGWIALWNTTGVADGNYTLNSAASYADGVRGTSPPITLIVDNPATLAGLATTNQTGSGTATLGGDGCDLAYLVADVNYGAGTQTIGGVDLQIEGCYNTDLTGSFTIITTNAGTLSGTASGPVTTFTPPCPNPKFCDPELEAQFTLTLTVTTGTGLFAGTTGALQVVLTSPASAPPTDIPFSVSVAAS